MAFPHHGSPSSSTRSSRSVFSVLAVLVMTQVILIRGDERSDRLGEEMIDWPAATIEKKWWLACEHKWPQTMLARHEDKGVMLLFVFIFYLSSWQNDDETKSERFFADFYDGWLWPCFSLATMFAKRNWGKSHRFP